MPTEEAGLSRAEVWRLVDDSNKRWMDAHDRQTDAINRLSSVIADLIKRLEKHEDEDAGVHQVVHDLKVKQESIQLMASRKFLVLVGLTSVTATFILNYFFHH